MQFSVSFAFRNGRYKPRRGTVYTAVRNPLAASMLPTPLQKAVFYLPKDGLLRSKRWPFAGRKAVNWDFCIIFG